MHFEYLFNNDTQEISQRVSELASSNEPALRAHCQEVSRQTDTSSLALQEDCIAKVNAATAILQKISVLAEELSKSLMRNSGVFGVQNGQAVSQYFLQFRGIRLDKVEKRRNRSKKVREDPYFV